MVAREFTLLGQLWFSFTFHLTTLKNAQEGGVYIFVLTARPLDSQRFRQQAVVTDEEPRPLSLPPGKCLHDACMQLVTGLWFVSLVRTVHHLSTF